jgi:DNA-directed RNA polymerase subunit RPC12/RpoP
VQVGLTEAQRRRAARQVVAIVVLWLFGAAIVSLVNLLSGSNRVDLTVLLGFLVPVTLLLLIAPGRWLARRQHQAALAEAGRICAECGYSTTGLDETITRCPECGHPRERLPKERSSHADVQPNCRTGG